MCKFYKELYKKKEVLEKDIKNYLEKQNLPQISQHRTMTMLNVTITPRELFDAIKKMKRGKAPGPDGLTAIYYRMFQEELQIPLLMTMNNILESGKILEGWGKAFITIPKEGQDLTLTKNYRPISLLNNDHNIFVSIMATRLKYVLQECIHQD
uniref:Reverse transcriptase domain-containing protein n=1 Tax=Salvator merianae TaxID=96440 RepID=A0A8D0E419_SALMN